MRGSLGVGRIGPKLPGWMVMFWAMSSPRFALGQDERTASFGKALGQAERRELGRKPLDWLAAGRTQCRSLAAVLDILKAVVRSADARRQEMGRFQTGRFYVSAAGKLPVLRPRISGRA